MTLTAAAAVIPLHTETVNAADHLDAPRSTANLPADITDLYATPSPICRSTRRRCRPGVSARSLRRGPARLRAGARGQQRREQPGAPRPLSLEDRRLPGRRGPLSPRPGAAAPRRRRAARLAAPSARPDGPRAQDRRGARSLRRHHPPHEQPRVHGRRRQHLAAGRTEDAKRCIADARKIYEAQLLRFPEAAHDHALGHFLEFGDDPARTVMLAEANHRTRPNAEAKISLARAYLSAGRQGDATTSWARRSRPRGTPPTCTPPPPRCTPPPVS